LKVADILLQTNTVSDITVGYTIEDEKVTVIKLISPAGPVPRINFENSFCLKTSLKELKWRSKYTS